MLRVTEEAPANLASRWVTRPNLRWAVRFGLFGCLVAVALLGLLHLSSDLWSLKTHFLVLSVAEVLWPSSILLLVTAGQEDTLNGWRIVAMSIAANATLYAFIGAIVSVFRPSLRQLLPFLRWG